MKCVVSLSLFGDYLISRNFSAATINRYTRDVKDFLLFTAKEDVRQINQQDILNYRQHIYECGRYKVASQRGMICIMSPEIKTVF